MEEELTHLEQEGIIEPVQFADWAAPIVSVMKDDGKSVRICSDFKLTINQASKLDHYLILRIEDLFAKLNGGKSFSKLDMSQAYQQVILEEDLRPYAVINTHRIWHLICSRQVWNAGQSVTEPLLHMVHKWKSICS